MKLAFASLLLYFAADFTLSMKRILSERNLVGLLFVSALVIFVFAQQDITKAVESNNPANISTVMPPSPPQEASVELNAPAEIPAITPAKK